MTDVATNSNLMDAADAEGDRIEQGILAWLMTGIAKQEGRIKVLERLYDRCNSGEDEPFALKTVEVELELAREGLE